MRRLLVVALLLCDLPASAENRSVKAKHIIAISEAERRFKQFLVKWDATPVSMGLFAMPPSKSAPQQYYYTREGYRKDITYRVWRHQATYYARVEYILVQPFSSIYDTKEEAVNAPGDVFARLWLIYAA